MDYRNFSNETTFDSDLAMERKKASTYVEGVAFFLSIARSLSNVVSLLKLR